MQRKTWRLSDKMMRRWWNAGNAVKDTMPCKAAKLPSAIYPGVWAAASLTAETEGVLLYICVRSSHILGCIIYISCLLIQPPRTSHHNYSQCVAAPRHWRLQKVTGLNRAHQSAGLSRANRPLCGCWLPESPLGKVTWLLSPFILGHNQKW